MLSTNAFVSWILVLSCFRLLNFAVPQVPKEEVDVLQQIVTAMGAKFWKFNANLCDIELVGVTQIAPSGSEGYVDCDCTYENNTVCHVTKIVLKSYNLPGILSPEIVKLPYLRDIDFAYNLLTGTIPIEWASTQLNFVSLLVNLLSGKLPEELGNITTLTYLSLEVNQFSGSIPSELGKLINLKTLVLSSNQFTGNLPTSFSELINLDDFRINDNNFSGPIPEFIQNWKRLTHLEMHASGLEGPIPSSISFLTMLTALRISDIKGPTQGFPVLRSTTSIVTLVLRNCNISGKIPAYVWKFRVLQMLDVSFNKLVGNIPYDIARNLKVVFVTGNMLSGNIPDALLKDGSNIDLSYNNFTLKGPDQSACQSNINQNVNLFKSSATVNPPQQMLPCTRNVDCPRYKCSFHVNCGGGNLEIKESNRKVTYEGDVGGDARFLSASSYWGFTSSGEFMDLPSNQNSRSIRTTSTANLSELYCTARLSPLSLTYYHYCLENGSYSVNLHFAEILFTNDNTYNKLGKRMFDIYIQEKLVWKDFNIEDEARGAQRPVTKPFNVTVSDNTLEIRFYWASKGTTRIPNKGDYGSIISAISVIPNFKICSNGGKKNLTVYVSVGVVAICLIFSIFGFLWWKGCLKGRKRKDFEGLELQTVSFTLKQIKVATNNFDPTNKIGEGGFGPVYKGQLSDGTVTAVKQLSSKSRQGNRSEESQLMLDWPTRLNEEEKTHISTQVAGTIGYMAPEYALWGHLTDKADVYSFGVVLLEIVSGKSNNTYMPSSDYTCLLDMACHLQETNCIDKLLDKRLGSQVNPEEVERTAKVAVLCTNSTASVRPTMSEVVQMLEGNMDIPDAPNEGNDVRFKTIKGLNQEWQNRSSSGNQTQKSAIVQTDAEVSTQSLNLLSPNREQGSGFEGPIPSSISILKNLTELRIGDLNGGASEFPLLRDMKRMQMLMLRSCKLSGNIPGDLSFNKLKGDVANLEGLSYLEIIQIDLSYNNFYESSVPSSCRETLNLFRSFSRGNSLEATVGNAIFEADEESAGSEKFVHSKENWGSSSTGYFLGRNISINDYTANNVSVLKVNDSELYTSARLSPLSLTYYRHCLANGNYTVTLHFAEIIFRDNRSFRSLGRRMFDVYIQGERKLNDFDIEKDAKGVDKVVKQKFKAMVKNKTLEIRFHYSGKGSTTVPSRGTYGPLISAISVESDFKPPSKGKKKIFIATGAAASAFFLILIILCFSWWKGYIGGRISREQELRGLDLRTRLFTLDKSKLLQTILMLQTKLGKVVSDLSTSGYMAPEYAMWGYLTYKADVYSFGVVALEIVAGKNNMKYCPNDNFVCLLDWAMVLQNKGRFMELVDPRLSSNFDKEEAERMTKVALLCTNPSPALRPTMSTVCGMLEGYINVQEFKMDPSIYEDELKFQSLREKFQDIRLNSSETRNLIHTV
ncbi:unnamed protein product [Fraxinus pennsylvanica]|uniref:non-specific serine/threonine protein kinase n=1 Tax=Fraxinus pennsylvanica TaxID=56036 RepID=A0AAD1Z0Q0_9LAMI|nr:unnamed protein product [Fraxinus pennsylvanica]